MQNIAGFSFTEFRLTVGTPTNGSVSFKVEDIAGIIHNGTVTPNAPVFISIPNSHQVTGSDYNNRQRGIRVYSTEGSLLYVVAENFISFLNHGAYLAYPCLSLGRNIGQYRYGIISSGNPLNAQRSQILLVGCENGTAITVAPTRTISLPMDIQTSSTSVTIESGASSHEIFLNKLQTLLVSSTDDLTGTIITSNKPLTVISGHECANIPQSEAGCEPLAVQVPPIATWGTRFLLAPFAGRNGPQAFKAVSSNPNTSYVYTCGLESRSATRTNTLYFYSTSYCYLQSTHPVFLTQLSFGGTVDNMGDPAISIISPLDQYVHEIDFISLPTSYFGSNYISVTVATENYNPASILLDGQAINCTWQEVRDNENHTVGYGCSKTISSNLNVPRKHRISHSAKNGVLSVLVYGFNAFPGRGYSYLAGQVLETTEGNNITMHCSYHTLSRNVYGHAKELG